MPSTNSKPKQGELEARIAELEHEVSVRDLTIESFKATVMDLNMNVVDMRAENMYLVGLLNQRETNEPEVTHLEAVENESL